MSVSKNCRVTPEQAINARNEFRLGEFRRHKPTLLNCLRDAAEHHIQPKPFDAERSWLDLEYVARLHLGFKNSHKRVASLNPAKPLDELVTALSRASALFPTAIKEGGDGALLRAWQGEARMTLGSAIVFEAGSTRIVDQFLKALHTLRKLEATTKRAFNEVRRKPGSPVGSRKLPGPDVIIGLAGAYRRITGLKPATTKGGLFDIFAYKYFKALGYGNLNRDSLVAALKRARHQAGLYAKTSARPSPFARG
jgi:hypothetical protein